MSGKNLFEDFKATSKEEWLNKIEKDLKGKPYDSLTSDTPDNINIQAVYTEGDFPETGSQTFRRNKDWKIVQEILVMDMSEANKEALDHLNRGADSLIFYISAPIDLSVLLKDIMIEHISIHFVLERNSKEMVGKLKQLIAERNLNPEDIHGSVNIDCLENLARTGDWYKSEDHDFLTIKDLAYLVPPNFRSICINTNLYGNAGATLSQQLGISLSMIYEYIYRLELKFADKFWINFSVGSDYFGEIAKLRAFRRLWAKLLDEVTIPYSETHIYAETALRNKTIKDAYNNMIRTSAEAMAAGIGGCDEFSAKGFDVTFRESTLFGERIAKNQQSILQYESHINKVADISKGSYFIESLTEELAAKGWAFFKEIENRGGHINVLKSGWLQEQVHKAAKAEQKRFDEGEKVLIGANKHVKKDENLKEIIKRGLFCHTPEKGAIIQPVRVERLSEKLEK